MSKASMSVSVLQSPTDPVCTGGVARELFRLFNGVGRKAHLVMTAPGSPQSRHLLKGLSGLLFLFSGSRSRMSLRSPRPPCCVKSGSEQMVVSCRFVVQCPANGPSDV